VTDITWISIPGSPSLGIEEQWQARVPGHGSAAVFCRGSCEYPRCCGQMCVVHVYHGERHDVVDCRAPAWRGVVMGPDGMVQDVAIETRCGLDAARDHFEDILERLWEGHHVEEAR
jgi:hypothetical protein